MNDESLTTEPSIERGLFVSLITVLLGFGTVMVHSASITSWPTEFEQIYLSRHLLFLAIGASAAGLAALLPARIWHGWAPLFFVLTVSLLIAVLIPGVGTRVNGAQRWLRGGGFSLQPSELAKIALPLLMCRLLCNRRESLGRPMAGTFPVIWPLAIAVPLVLVEPDLGTSLFLALGAGIVLFIGGWPIRNFLLGLLAAIPAAIGLVALKPYQLKRVSGFVETWADLNQAPYQLKQSLVSLGAGGIWGVGLGKGGQKLSFLPEANTDFVFAVVGEELGLVGTLGVLLLWMGVFWTGCRLLSPLDRRGFASIAGTTLLMQVMLQAMLNMAVVTALVPPKGISHPLLSYGGSNLVVSLLSLGIVVSLSRADADRDAIVSS